MKPTPPTPPAPPVRTPPTGQDRAMSPVAAARLLTAGLTEPQRPIDTVIARLRQPDGAAWLASALHALLSPLPLATPRGADPVAALRAGEMTLGDLVAVKEAAKAAMADPKLIDRARGAIAAYFFATAAALKHHGAKISSRPRGELDPILVDLADAAPPAWRDLLMDAASTATTGSDRGLAG